MHLIKGNQTIQLSPWCSFFNLEIFRDTRKAPPYQFQVEAEVPMLTLDELKRLHASLGQTIEAADKERNRIPDALNNLLEAARKIKEENSDA